MARVRDEGNIEGREEVGVRGARGRRGWGIADRVMDAI